MPQKILEFVNEFSFCCHSTIKKTLWNSFYLMVANSEKKHTIFDLTFDTHDNPGDIFKIYKWVWNFFIPHLLVWTGAKNTSKTQHFLMCFCCVLHQKTPRFFKWGGYWSFFSDFMENFPLCTHDCKRPAQSSRVVWVYESWDWFMTSNWSYFEFSRHILQQYLLCLNVSVII